VQILKTVAEQINILPYEITIIVLIFILANGFAYLAYKLYQEFGWSIYKKIGADMAMRGKYKKDKEERVFLNIWFDYRY